MVGLHVIEADGTVADADLARTGLGIGQGLGLEDFGAAGAVDLDGQHGLLLRD